MFRGANERMGRQASASRAPPLIGPPARARARRYAKASARVAWPGTAQARAPVGREAPSPTPL